jgi:hypothetical protein
MQVASQPTAGFAAHASELSGLVKSVRVQGNISSRANGVPFSLLSVIHLNTSENELNLF